VTGRTGGRRREPPDAVELPPLAPFAGPSLAANGDYEAVDFVELDLAGQAADDAALLGCRLDRCGLDGVSLRRARISDCMLADIHATSLDATDSTWRDSLLAVGRIGALLACGVTWTRVRVRGGKIDLLDLSGSHLVDVVLEACAIGVLDLGEAELRSVRFDGCTIEDLDVAGARLSDVDLAGATLRLVRGIGGLRGATIGPGQLLDLAPLLAAHAGLRVRAG
jgi:uncharacterized protein YjbI with pentapeptide repeats